MPAAAAAMSRRAGADDTGAEAALSCSTVYNTLMPCLPYVQSGGPAARGSSASIVSGARTTPDRSAVCTCLKDVAGGPYISRAVGLPGWCGVPLPYKLSPSMNCNSYVADTNTKLYLS